MRAEINVTPLIDVMLVLLILFMVMTPTATRSLDARIPDPRADGAAPAEPLVVTVEAEGFRLNGRPIAAASDLEAELRDALSNRADRTVFVRADGKVTYGRVVEGMDCARGAGAERIGILGTNR